MAGGLFTCYSKNLQRVFRPGAVIDQFLNFCNCNALFLKSTFCLAFIYGRGEKKSRSQAILYMLPSVTYS